ncbi:MAG: family 16 glycosylhydrolase [Puniceicoccaceae bacterium]
MKRYGLTLLAAAAAGLTALHGDTPPGYTLQWADEFDYTGAPDPSKWTHEIGAGGWGNNEVQVYTDSLDNSRVEEGRLIIEVRQTGEGRSPNYTSARLITRDKAEFKFGRIEARIKLPLETGTWPAFWMLAAEQTYGTQYWPDNGEIDVLEAVGYEQDPLFKNLAGDQQLPNVHGTIHTFQRNGSDNTGLGGSTFLSDVSSEYHEYAINWSDGRIEWEVDGNVYFSLNRDDLLPSRNPPSDPWKWWPFDKDFFLILNVAVGGSWGGHFNSGFYPTDSPYGLDGIDHDGVWPQRMEVDYVRVYSAEPLDDPWNGPAPDASGYLQTDSWMGWINVSNAPWIYSHNLNSYFLPTSVLEDEFRTDNQWIYIPR